MAKQKLYWVGPGVFGGGENAVKIGEEMPTNLTDEHLKALKAQGLVSTEKTVTERQLSELEQSKATIATLTAKVVELESGKGESKKEKALQTRVDELTKEIAVLTDPENGKADPGAGGKSDKNGDK